MTTAQLQIVDSVEEEGTNKIIVCIASQDWAVPQEDFDISFDDSEQQILTVLRPAIEEQFGVNVNDADSGWLYKTRKATNSRNIYIIPNSTAGIYF